MFHIIQTTENTMVEQLKAQYMVNPKRTQWEKFIPNVHEKRIERDKINKKYCSYHNVSTHNTAECINMNNSNNNKDKTFALKKKTEKADIIELKGPIKDKNVNLLIDSGSVFSYVGEKTVIEIELKVNKIEYIKLEVASGDSVKFIKRLNLNYY